MEPSEEIRRITHRWLTNYAARVAGQALGGEVLVSSLVRELASGSGPGITFLERRDVELKGLEGSHRIYAVDLTAAARRPGV